MHLVVGLGNPGAEYARTRHNVGFMVVDRLAADLGIEVGRVWLRSLVGLGYLDGKRIILAKPLTYMNRSGEAVGLLLRWYGLTPQELLVVSDDLDLPVGQLRLRRSGSSGGHRGLQSVIERLGGGDFARLRVGIGRPPEGVAVVDWVLSEFAPEELPAVERAVAEASQAVRLALTEGMEAAMNRFNARRAK
ncbi:aminoacyl-tRNA hydrolase [Desulfovirgula thermocuniculi]|uniref:aminoacyl-tRNA hydrolase n=1 Tax=Desulfovirgula thermocuniculi TaxID=348842 RepID=UPI00048505D7|nr:aminoacyl-tRNA hydrolase [Desulfovirgula thermocuniculi]